ncbi:MAG: PAS domain-containing protein [Steroidobacteraceae bacterium]|jgi:PAS domain S-box-containing protein|nr:PAS domain-containing protein [Steroidobacteraceae bacterium]
MSSPRPDPALPDTGFPPASLDADAAPLELALEAMQAHVFDWNVREGRLQRSRGCSQLLGFGNGLLEGTPEAWRERVHPQDLEQVMAAGRAATSGREPRVTAEYRVRHADGTWLWVQEHARLQYASDGSVQRVAGCVFNIDARKRAELALRDREERLRLALHGARMGTWTAYTDGRQGEADETALALLGATPEEWARDPALVQSRFVVEDTERVRRAVRATLQDGAPYEVEFRIRRADGSVRWVASFGQAERDPQGKVVAIRGVTADISSRKAAEERIGSIRDALSASPSSTDDFEPLQETREAPRAGASPGARRATVSVTGAPGPVPEPGFDPITRLAAGVLQAPMALFTVVDEDRLRCVGGYGLPAAPGAGPEALRAARCCRLVVEGEAPVSIHDARQNPLMAAAPAPTGAGDGADDVLACLATPVRDRNGVVIGSLAVADSVPRAWTRRDLLTLQGISRLLVHELELRSALRDLAASEGKFRESDTLLRTVLSSTPDLVWVKDRAGRITLGNEATFATLGGGDASRVLGADAARLVPDPDEARTIAANDARVLQEGRSLLVEERLTADGGTRIFQTVKAPLRAPGGDIVGIVGVSRDVTAQKQGEEALREADRRKDEFLAMLAHELRNPLAPIRNASALLSRLLADDPRVQAPVAMIRRQSGQLTRLVDDLLDVSRIAQGRIELDVEVLEIGEIVEQAVEVVQPLVGEKRHALQVHRPAAKLYVRGDRVRLVQAASNVLHNAAKYTPSGGTITVAIAATDELLDVQVRDDGVGIPAELLPHVFDLFVQSERTLDRSQGGLGIGLSVVKRLVEMHGGTVEVQSPGPGRGSTFTLRLRREAPPRPVAPPPGSRAPVRPHRILVVDDNVDAADSMAMLLQLEGHAAQAVYGATAALAAIAAQEPDMVLLDIGMPEMDGYEVARRIRGREPVRRMRLVALTGYGQEADVARSTAAGFDAHLVKPADPEALARLFDAPAPEPDRH